MRGKISLDLRKEREKLISRKKINTPVIREKSNEFSLAIQNRYSQLHDEMEVGKEEMNSNLTKIILESAQEIGGKVPKENQGKLSENTKETNKERYFRNYFKHK